MIFEFINIHLFVILHKITNYLLYCKIIENIFNILKVDRLIINATYSRHVI